MIDILFGILTRVACVAPLAILALPAPAAAQSAAAIQIHLKQAAPGCQLYNYEENYRGPLTGADGPVVIATYTLVGCGGGSNWGRTVRVFQMANGRVRQFKPPAPPIEGPNTGAKGVTVAGACFTVQAMTLGPNDSRCCPTVRVTKTYRLVNGAIVAAR